MDDECSGLGGLPPVVVTPFDRLVLNSTTAKRPRL